MATEKKLFSEFRRRPTAPPRKNLWPNIRYKWAAKGERQKLYEKKKKPAFKSVKAELRVSENDDW